MLLFWKYNMQCIDALSGLYIWRRQTNKGYAYWASMSFFCRKMVWKDFAGIFPGQQLSGQLRRKEVRQSLCVHCVPVCACVPPVLPWTAAVGGDKRGRQRVREARPENFLCFFVLRKLEESHALDQIPLTGW